MSIDIPISAFEAMLVMARDPNKRVALVQDETCMGGLVLVLSNTDLAIVNKSLEVLMILAQCPEHRHLMKNFIGLVSQLESLFSHSNPKFQEMSKEIYTLLCNGPLRDTANQHRQQTEQSQKPTSACNKKEPSQRRRRNSFFIGGGISKSKVVILQIRGLNDRDDVDTCRNCLLTVKGVVSITVDFNRKRATLRTKPDLNPELLARAISRTMTMVAEQVIKDEDGVERLFSFGPNAAALNKENEQMPDYPEEETSPVLGYKNMARVGGAKKKENWTFVKSVGNFISNSFYW